MQLTLRLALLAAVQVDHVTASLWFEAARVLCERDGGRLWGVSLHGPMVIADAESGTLAANRELPEEGRPPALGYANTALPWGGERWSTFVWSMVPRENSQARGRLLMHELFHRVQFDLGLFTPDGENGHLDTLEGRTWIRLEWRALASALAGEGEARTAALSDALAFRARRRDLFEGSGENERREEIREGLAQYTGTVLSTASPAAAVADTLEQLAKAETEPTFVRTFGYTLGVAYGLLLDVEAPDWRERVRVDSDLGTLLAEATRIEATPDADEAAGRYEVGALRTEEELREREHLVRVAELRRRFVEEPVLILQRGNNASYVTLGSISIPGEGTTLAQYRAESEWGRLEAEMILVRSDGKTLALPAPINRTGETLLGEGWTIELKSGWDAELAGREGDWVLARE
jgi:hypothetical protein